MPATSDRPLDGIALRGRRQLDQERLQARHARQRRMTLYGDLLMLAIGLGGAILIVHRLGWI